MTLNIFNIVRIKQQQSCLLHIEPEEKKHEMRSEVWLWCASAVGVAHVVCCGGTVCETE